MNRWINFILAMFLFAAAAGCGDGSKKKQAAPTQPPIQKSVLYTNAGDVKSYSVYQYDEMGKKTRITSYNGAGADNEWFTTDDDIASYVG